MATKRSPPTFLLYWINQGRRLFKLTPDEPTRTQKMVAEEVEKDNDFKNPTNQNPMTPAFELAKKKQNKAFQEFIKSILAISVSVDNKNKHSKNPRTPKTKN